jgi:hypothetical protein
MMIEIILLDDDGSPWNEAGEELRRHPIARRPMLRNVDEQDLDRFAAPLEVADIPFVDFYEIGIRRNIAIESRAKAVARPRRRMKECSASCEAPL